MFTARSRSARLLVAGTALAGLAAGATVRLTVYRRAHGGWHSTGTQVVGKRRGWFWFVTSGPHAVCRFSVSDTPRRAVTVRLLVTPSIGCAARTQHFHVENGQLVAG